MMLTARRHDIHNKVFKKKNEEWNNANILKGLEKFEDLFSEPPSEAISTKERFKKMKRASMKKFKSGFVDFLDVEIPKRVRSKRVTRANSSLNGRITLKKRVSTPREDQRTATTRDNRPSTSHAVSSTTQSRASRQFKSLKRFASN